MAEQREACRPITGPRSSVVVVNVDPYFQKVLAHYLEERRWKVYSDANPREVLERWDKFDSYLVVTDLDGPATDGFEFLQALSALSPRPHVLVCASGAAVEQLGNTVFTRLGIDAVLERPCHPAAVETVLSCLMQEIPIPAPAKCMARGNSAARKLPKAAIVIGTRPEAIKLAPVVRALRDRQRLEPLLVSTGQHRQMLDQALEVFGLQPDIDLALMSPGQTLHDITARALGGMRDLLHEHQPAWVVVQGDTTTAFAAALAAFYAKLPVAHVEAGLRSGKRYSPFPEEINRKLIDQLSDLFFAPTDSARQLLLRESFPADKIHVTGNTVVDALLAARDVARRKRITTPGLSGEMLRGKRMVLVTAHRRESFGPGVEAMCRAMLRIVKAHPDTCIVYPVHLNPNVDGPVRQFLQREPRIFLLPPIPYLEFVALLDRADFVLTDSGGVQEEAPTFHKPILVMREVTERPEGITAGVARLVGTSEDRIFEEATKLLSDPEHYASMASGHNPYGDGLAAMRIAEILEQELETRKSPEISCKTLPSSKFPSLLAVGQKESPNPIAAL